MTHFCNFCIANFPLHTLKDGIACTATLQGRVVWLNQEGTLYNSMAVAGQPLIFWWKKIKEQILSSVLLLLACSVLQSNPMTLLVHAFIFPADALNR